MEQYLVFTGNTRSSFFAAPYWVKFSQQGFYSICRRFSHRRIFSILDQFSIHHLHCAFNRLNRGETIFLFRQDLQDLMDYFFFCLSGHRPRGPMARRDERQKNLIRLRRKVATSLAHLYSRLPGLPLFTLNLDYNILEQRENHLCWWVARGPVSVCRTDGIFALSSTPEAGTAGKGEKYPHNPVNPVWKNNLIYLGVMITDRFLMIGKALELVYNPFL